MFGFILLSLFVLFPSVYAQKKDSSAPSDPFASTEVFIPYDKRSKADPPQASYVTVVPNKKQKISVLFQETPLPEILKYLTEQTGRRFAAHSSLKNVIVTVKERDKKWTKIIEGLIYRYGLKVESIEGVIKLSKVVVAEEPKSKASEKFFLLFRVSLLCFFISVIVLMVRIFIIAGKVRHYS
jgi:hypothetical protein